MFLAFFTTIEDLSTIFDIKYKYKVETILYSRIHLFILFLFEGDTQLCRRKYIIGLVIVDLDSCLT